MQNTPTSASLSKSQFSYRAGLSSGQPIGRLMAQALAYPNLVSLAAGFVDNATLPCEAVERVVTRLANQPELLRKSLQYASTAGNDEFRRALVDWNYRDWPDAKPNAERVILTAGSNQFLHLLAEALLDPGDIVIAASPTYFVFLGMLRGVGARAIGVQADDDGMCMDALSETLDRIVASGDAKRLKAIYTVTDFDNPGGSTLTLQRRQRLIEMVQRWRREHGPLLIFSDNAYQLLRFDGEALPPLPEISADAQDFVIELGTFSKSFSPGIRVGWGVVPDSLVPQLLEIKSNIDFGSPHFSQVIMLETLRSGEFDRHLPVILEGYRAKRNAMLDALERHMSGLPGVHWREPKGGLYVWLTLPEHIDASDTGLLWQHATQNGVLYVPGGYCFPPEGVPAQANTIRLSYGVQSCQGVSEGILRISDAIRQAANAGIGD